MKHQPAGIGSSETAETGSSTLLTDELARSVGPRASYSPGEGVEYSQKGYIRVLEQGEVQERAGNQSKVACRVMSWQRVCGKEGLRAIAGVLQTIVRQGEKREPGIEVESSRDIEREKECEEGGTAGIAGIAGILKKM